MIKIYAYYNVLTIENVYTHIFFIGIWLKFIWQIKVLVASLRDGFLTKYQLSFLFCYRMQGLCNK